MSTLTPQWRSAPVNDQCPVDGGTAIEVIFRDDSKKRTTAENITWSRDVDFEHQVKSWRELEKDERRMLAMSTDDLMHAIKLERMHEEEARQAMADALAERKMLCDELNRRLTSTAGVTLNDVMKPTGALKR